MNINVNKSVHYVDEFTMPIDGDFAGSSNANPYLSSSQLNSENYCCVPITVKNEIMRKLIAQKPTVIMHRTWCKLHSGLSDHVYSFSSHLNTKTVLLEMFSNHSPS